MKNRNYSLLLVLIIGCSSCNNSNKEKSNNVEYGWEYLSQEAANSGKPEWQPMLKFVAELHKKSTHPAEYPFSYDWEEIGPGYIYGPAFGHWDIVHQCLDLMEFFPEHALHQLLKIRERRCSKNASGECTR